jgi:hypothetical protein
VRTTPGQRFAERILIGVDDAGAEERLVVWIELRPGALWVVGRAVNPHLRETDEPRAEDVIFEGYELDDALQRLNEALEDDLRVLEEDRREPSVRPVTRSEIEPHLERYLLTH